MCIGDGKQSHSFTKERGHLSHFTISPPTIMSSFRQHLSKLKSPKPSTALGLGLCAGVFYVAWSTNERKKRVQQKIHQVKDDFNRIKVESTDKLKQAKEEFKCQPAVQEAQEKANEFKSKWQEGKARLKESRTESKEAMKRNRTFQELAMRMPDLAKRIEGEMDLAMEMMEVLDNDEHVAGMLATHPGDEEQLSITIQGCRDSMARLKELLQQDGKKLGWSLTVAAELNTLRTQTAKLKTWMKVSDEVAMEESIGSIDSIETMRDSE